jgi:predicted unusual protein kinase regulating ubiquinone biosynthesis (AarF/ABC1/UbiB family)
MRTIRHLLHTLRVVVALGPFVVSISRDRRRWLWWGAPLHRSASSHRKRAEALVARIIGLGPTFVKAAQVFAARADLIPEPYLSELGKLVDSVPPVPWTAIEAQLLAAYGKPVSELFESIEQRPVAAASLGQVHRARWKGKDVAVKVLRPNVEHSVARDIAAFRAIIRWCLRTWPTNKHVIGFDRVTEEFAIRIAEEVDFRLEAAYATEVRENFKGNARVVIPEVMAEMTRQRVLVLQFIEGSRVDQLAPSSPEAQRLAPLVIEVYVQMMLVDGLFHADPHAGNLLWTADGRLVLLDFGMMVRVTSQLRLALIRTVFAAVRHDPKAVAEGFYTLDLVAPGAQPEEIRKLTELLVAMSVSRTTTKERLDWFLAENVMKSLYDFPVMLPRELVYFGRAAMLIEGLGSRYDPYFNGVQVGTPIVMRLRSRILNSLGEEASPSIEEVAAIAGWAVGRAWRKVQDIIAPWRSVATTIATAVLMALPMASVTAQSSAADSLHQAIAAALVEEQLVGATWAVVTPSGTTLGAAGLFDATTTRALRPEDRVQVGSVTKAVLALGVLRLVSEGQLSLDEPVSVTLRDLPVQNRFARTSPMLVRHLLDHTSGLDDARLWQLFSRRPTPDTPLIDGLVRSGDSLRVRHRPGSRFSYSNSGFVVAAMLIEKVTRTRYEVYLDSAILAPIGLTRSTFAYVTQAEDSTLAMGHFENGVASPAVPTFVRPAGQFTTTAGDMAALARFLMGDGRVGTRQLIDPALLRARGREFNTDASRNGLNAGYALAWARRDRHGVIAGCHDGNIVGYWANLCVFPEEQKAFFISLNADVEGADYDRFDALLIDALDVAPVDAVGAAALDADPSAFDGWYLRRPIRLDQFAYLDEVLNFTRVQWNGEALILDPFQGDPRTLTPVGGTQFRATDRSAASHILYTDDAGTALIGDGLRTHERVPLTLLMVRWLSLIAGILGLAHLAFWGVIRGIRARWKAHGAARALSTESVALGLIALILWSIMRDFDFLTLGDPTVLNIVIALLCVVGLVRLLVYAWRLARANESTLSARLDLLATGAALQWLLVLASWGLFPLALWR